MWINALAAGAGLLVVIFAAASALGARERGLSKAAADPELLRLASDVTCQQLEGERWLVRGRGVLALTRSRLLFEPTFGRGGFDLPLDQLTRAERDPEDLLAIQLTGPPARQLRWRSGEPVVKGETSWDESLRRALAGEEPVNGGEGSAEGALP